LHHEAHVGSLVGGVWLPTEEWLLDVVVAVDIAHVVTVGIGWWLILVDKNVFEKC